MFPVVRVALIRKQAATLTTQAEMKFAQEVLKCWPTKLTMCRPQPTQAKHNKVQKSALHTIHTQQSTEICTAYNSHTTKYRNLHCIQFTHNKVQKSALHTIHTQQSTEICTAYNSHTTKYRICTAYNSHTTKYRNLHCIQFTHNKVQKSALHAIHTASKNKTYTRSKYTKRCALLTLTKTLGSPWSASWVAGNHSTHMHACIHTQLTLNMHHCTGNNVHVPWSS